MNMEEIIEAIEKMTVKELAELVKKLEDKFGVSAAAPAVAVAAPAAGGAAQAEAEEKNEFDVILNSFGSNKIAVIKVVREITGLGLKEAKELVEKAGTPDAVIKNGIPKNEAEEIKQKLTEAGADVTLK